MASRTPRCFVAQTMLTTFGTVVLILVAVLVFVTLIVRANVRSTVLAHLTTQQATAIPTLGMDDNRFDTAAARAARKSALVAFSRS